MMWKYKFNTNYTPLPITATAPCDVNFLLDKPKYGNLIGSHVNIS